MQYNTISSKVTASFTEKKSEFIGFLCPVENEGDAIAFIDEIRSLHRKATHNCYCYILRHNNTVRYSDDGEPAGTAGIPIYETLSKSKITDVCCVVTRYFGGTLLGAGGLVRAYTKGAAMALENAIIKNMCMASLLTIKIDYHLHGIVINTLASFDIKVVDEKYTDFVEISLYSRENEKDVLISKLIDVCNGKITIENKQNCYYNFAKI